MMDEVIGEWLGDDINVRFLVELNRDLVKWVICWIDRVAGRGVFEDIL